MKPTTDKFKTNKHAKQMKAENKERALRLKDTMTNKHQPVSLQQDNLARKNTSTVCQDTLEEIMGTEEGVEMIKEYQKLFMDEQFKKDYPPIKTNVTKDSLWTWNGKELKPYSDKDLIINLITSFTIIGFALGILVAHFLFVMPNSS